MNYEKRIRFFETERPAESYANTLKKQVTLRLGVDVIEYFKQMAQETGIPYQNLVNLYLRQCAHSHKRLTVA